MQETITFSYTDCSMTIVLDEFFPCSAERIYKLLDAISEEPYYDRREEVLNRICKHLYDRAREIEGMLPGMHAEARAANAAYSHAFRALEKTREQIRKLQAKMAGKDLITKKKVRDQIDVMKQLKDSQNRTMKQAREYAYQLDRDRTLAKRRAERLRQNREQVLKWRDRKQL